MKIGVDIGGTNIRAGLVDGDKIMQQRSIVLKGKDHLETTLVQVTDLIEPFVSSEIQGIGIGVPSVVDAARGIVYNVANIPSWKEVHLKEILQKEFNVPVFVNNDVNCFILGEHGFGLVKNYECTVGIAIGTGLGGGVIIDNKLYCGSNCGAGEFGLLPYREHNIEYYCSNNFFDVYYDTSALEMYERALAGDQDARDIWHIFGEHLGNALMAILYAYDPEAVVFGGSISRAHPFFKERMLAQLSNFDYPGSIEKLKIFFSNNPDITLLGAAALSSRSGSLVNT